MTQALRGSPCRVRRGSLCCAFRATLVSRGLNEHLGFRIATRNRTDQAQRGGAFWLSPGFMCCADRNRDYPNDQDPENSFRIARRKK